MTHPPPPPPPPPTPTTFNPAREIDQERCAGFARLRQAGVTFLNPSGLLKGINDNARTLAALSNALFAVGILLTTAFSDKYRAGPLLCR